MVHVSTLIELLGFAFLVVAGWQFGLIAGLIVTGLVLLFIGFLIEDDKSLVVLRSFVALLKRLIPKRKPANP